MLPVSLDCSFLISLSVFSNVYLNVIHLSPTHSIDLANVRIRYAQNRKIGKPNNVTFWEQFNYITSLIEKSHSHWNCVKYKVFQHVSLLHLVGRQGDRCLHLDKQHVLNSHAVSVHHLGLYPINQYLNA
jgi:hypothetical protein